MFVFTGVENYVCSLVRQKSGETSPQRIVWVFGVLRVRKPAQTQVFLFVRNEDERISVQQHEKAGQKTSREVWIAALRL
jgi:hypothetical protein